MRRQRFTEYQRFSMYRALLDTPNTRTAMIVPTEEIRKNTSKHIVREISLFLQEEQPVEGEYLFSNGSVLTLRSVEEGGQSLSGSNYSQVIVDEVHYVDSSN